MIVNNINPYQGLQNAFIPDGGNKKAADSRQVSSVSQEPSNPAVVYDPPFFPIATYQRQDLITKVRSAVVEVESQSIDQGLQHALLVNKAKSDATETIRVASAGNIQPGEVLSVKA